MDLKYSANLQNSMEQTLKTEALIYENPQNVTSLPPGKHPKIYAYKIYYIENKALVDPSPPVAG